MTMPNEPIVVTLALVQDDGPVLGGGADASGAGTAASGGGGAPARASDPFSGMLPIFFVVIMLFIVWSFTSQRKEKKKRDALLGSIRKHDHVQTVGGIIGSVVEVKANTVILKVDESSNTRMTFAKSAIQQVLKESPEPEPEAKAPEA